MIPTGIYHFKPSVSFTPVAPFGSLGLHAREIAEKSFVACRRVIGRSDREATDDEGVCTGCVMPHYTHAFILSLSQTAPMYHCDSFMDLW